MTYCNKITCYVFIVFCTITSVVNADNSYRLAIGNDKYDLKIAPDPEIESLMNAHDFSKAEKLAREKNSDPRIIATIMAYAGKKDESLAILMEYISKVPEDKRYEISKQILNMLTAASPNFGQIFWKQILDRKIINIAEEQEKCMDIMLLLRHNKVEEAEKLFSEILASPYSDVELVNVGMTLIAKLNLNLNNAHKSKLLLEGLMRKFPDNETIKLQWIDALATTDPTKSLAELDGLKKNTPVFYGQMEKFVHLIKAKALENLKEIDRAKSEYKALLGSDFKSVAESKIFEYEEREKLEQELQDKIAQQNQSVEINQTRNSRRHLFIIGINIIGLVIIIFLIRKRRHE